MNYDIYVINLDRNTERKQRIDAQFKQLKLPYIRQPAIDGKKLEDSPLVSVIHPNALLSARRGFRISHDEHNYGSIGCYLSHAEVWKVRV